LIFDPVEINSLECLEWSGLLETTAVGSFGVDDVEFVDSDVVVGPTCVEDGAVLGPCEGGATKESLGFEGNVVGVDVWNFLDFLDQLLVGQVEHSDSLVGSNDQPVQLLGEEDNVDWWLAVDLSQVGTSLEVPAHDGSVTGAWGEILGVLDHVDGVDLGLVSRESVQELHVKIVPHLDGLVPWGSHNECWWFLVEELNAGNSISVLVLVDGVFAFTLGVPDLDLVVKTTGDDLSVVLTDADGENILGVTN